MLHELLKNLHSAEIHQTEELTQLEEFPINRQKSKVILKEKTYAKSTVTAATGVRNQRHKSRTDEVVYLYLRTC